MTKNRDLYPEPRPLPSCPEDRILNDGDKIILEGTVTSTRWNDFRPECYISFCTKQTGNSVNGQWFRQKHLLKNKIEMPTSGWQPIDTAPKDDIVHIRGFWMKDNLENKMVWKEFTGKLSNADTFVSEDGGYYGYAPFQFTHWMPRIEPPAFVPVKEIKEEEEKLENKPSVFAVHKNGELVSGYYGLFPAFSEDEASDKFKNVHGKTPEQLGLELVEYLPANLVVTVPEPEPTVKVRIMATREMSYVKVVDMPESEYQKLKKVYDSEDKCCISKALDKYISNDDIKEDYDWFNRVEIEEE